MKRFVPFYNMRLHLIRKLSNEFNLLRLSAGRELLLLEHVNINCTFGLHKELYPLTLLRLILLKVTSFSNKPVRNNL